MQTLAAAIERARQLQPGESAPAIGARFENLTAAVLPRLPEYDLAQVFPYADWQECERLTGYAPTPDRGIDLIGKLKNGKYVAIQCKCHTDKVNWKQDLPTFIAAAAPRPHPQTGAPFSFDLLMLVTAGEVSVTAAEELQKQNGIVVNLLHKHGDFLLDAPAAPAARQPNEKQQEAIAACAAGFAHNNRGRLIMACGTGKTFTALRVAEKLGARLILFAAPSIALVGQARREWLRHTARPLAAMVVCSDPTTGRGQKTTLDEVLLDSPVSRHPGKIAEFMRAAQTTATAADAQPRALFCTYQSLDKIRDAQQNHNAPAFHLAIIDEAHRTTGVEAATAAADKLSFQDIHADDNVRIQKRLYMTATPRIYTQEGKSKLAQKDARVYDMSDPAVYGPLFYRLKFRDAINHRDQNGAPLLCDYRLIVLLVPEKDTPHDLRRRLRNNASNLPAPARKKGASDLMRQVDKHITRIYGVAQAINGEIIAPAQEMPERIERVIGFCNTVRNSGFYADSLQNPDLAQKVAAQLHGKQPVAIKAQHLDASSNALSRASALARLNNAGGGACQTLCNVGLFNEGVDVPALDAVVFFEPRKSQVDVVQSVGRVMRRAPGKKLGYIIIPAAVPDSTEDLSLDNIISQDEEGYAAILQTLRALQSHDERLTENPAQMISIATVKPPVDDADDADSALNDSAGSDSAADRARLTERQLEMDLRADSIKSVTDDILAAVVQKSGLGNAGKLTADDIESAVKAAAKLLFNAGAASALAAAVSAPAATKQEAQSACIIAALILANACLLHKRLAALPGMKRLHGLQGFGAQPDPLAFLRQEWHTILERDYKPIFHPALAVLNALDAQPHAAPRLIALALQRIAECANNVADSLSDLGYDHAGPLYHKILGTAESDGAFYTTNTAALLLAKLALPPAFTDWADAQKTAALRIMDPACGTGTLLMAALKTIKEHAAAAQGLDAHGIKNLHKSLVENAVCGLDINHQAVQIAASNLTLGAPDVDYRRMNMHTMQHGIMANGDAKAGSLELLTGDDLSHFTRQTHTLQSAAAAQVDDSDVDFPVRDLDLIIMNPPYSNNTKRSARFSAADKTKMQRREHQLKSEVESRQGITAANVIDSNSISTFFTPLAESMLCKKSGSLAKVMPVAGCTNASGLDERKFLANKFHIERLIVSHAKTGHAFSGNTGIHECLLLARRHVAKGGGTCCLATQIVVLRKMPQNSEDVNSVVAAINSGDMGDWGTLHHWPADRMRAGDWSPVQWFNGELVQAAQTVRENTQLSPLNQTFAIGPVGQAIRAAFDHADAADANAAPIFYSKSAKLRSTLHAECTEYGKPKPGKEATAPRLLQNGGHFLISTRINTQSGVTAGIYSPVPAIGSGWIPVLTQTKEQAMALAVWWNSTPMWINLLNNRGTQLTWPMWAVKELNAMPIPNLTPQNTAILMRAYQQIATRPLCRMKDAANDPARIIIDEAAAQVAGLPAATLHHWRALLSQEPTINPQ